MSKAGITQAELELVNDIVSFTHNPYEFVIYAFPWGEGELKEHTGPDEWQKDILVLLGDLLKSGVKFDEAFSLVIQIAVASGNGIGKSALICWLILWGLSTFEDTRGVVTAGTDTQLKTKTWAELAKWHRLCICGHWFEYTATAIYSRDPEHERTWRVDAIPWNKTRPDAFAGLHNQGKRILILCDEASAIDDIIHETINGALTDLNTEIIFVAFGTRSGIKGGSGNASGSSAIGGIPGRWTAGRLKSPIRSSCKNGLTTTGSTATSLKSMSAGSSQRLRTCSLSRKTLSRRLGADIFGRSSIISLQRSLPATRRGPERMRLRFICVKVS